MIYSMVMPKSSTVQYSLFPCCVNLHHLHYADPKETKTTYIKHSYPDRAFILSKYYILYSIALLTLSFNLVSLFKYKVYGTEKFVQKWPTSLNSLIMLGED